MPTSLLCVGLVAGAIECFWHSAQIEHRDDGRDAGSSRRLWRLTGATLIALALGLTRRQLGPD